MLKVKHNNVQPLSYMRESAMRHHGIDIQYGFIFFHLVMPSFSPFADGVRESTSPSCAVKWCNQILKQNAFQVQPKI